MAWQLSNREKQQQLEKFFSVLGIDYASPGFLDSRSFLKAERQNSRILEKYAEYIEVRAYTEEYLSEVRPKVEIVARRVNNELMLDGGLGKCLYVAGMIGRMLDELGIWNYQAKACLTINYPEGTGFEPEYFWAVNEQRFDAPHAVVVAPPFYVIDASCNAQQYEEDQRSLIPLIVLQDDFIPVEITAEDLLAPEIHRTARLTGLTMQRYMQLHHCNMLEVSSALPPRGYRSMAGVRMKYVLVAAAGTEEPLSGLTGYLPSNRLPIDIFREDVLPEIAEL